MAQATPADTQHDSDWIEWQGGECPVDSNVLVETRHRDGDEFTIAGDEQPLTAGEWHPSLWRHGDDEWPVSPADIVAYRVVRA